MPDLAAPGAAASPGAPSEEAPSTTPSASDRAARLRDAVEALFFAYRDFTGDADAILAEYGFGRAHHRAVYFVGREPGITVSDLLSTLRITKQSLSRVLAQLLDEGFLVQQTDEGDKRRRRLHLTNKGRALEARLTGVQFERLERAYAQAAQDLGVSEREAEAAFVAVLEGMVG
jgi:DNA-binding MarR family transcriptional regulator